MAKLTRFFQKIIQNIFNFAVAPLAGAWIEIEFDALRDKAIESLPSRERGLKYNYLVESGHGLPSLPSRERGLKSFQIGQTLSGVTSLPSRERGLK